MVFKKIYGVLFVLATTVTGYFLLPSREEQERDEYPRNLLWTRMSEANSKRVQGSSLGFNALYL